MVVLWFCKLDMHSREYNGQCFVLQGIVTTTVWLVLQWSRVMRVNKDGSDLMRPGMRFPKDQWAGLQLAAM